MARNLTNIILRHLFTISAFFLFPIYSYAAAWVQPKGSGQFILTNSYYESSRSFNKSGNNTKSLTSFRKEETNPFIEYGLTDNITIGLNAFVQKATFEKSNPSSAVFDFRQCGVSNNNFAVKSTQNIFESEIFLRRKLYERNNFIFSMQPLIKTPCAVADDSGMKFINGTMDAEMRLLAGYGFKWEQSATGIKRPFAGQYHFAGLETAYRKRGDNFSDQLKIEGTGGFRLNNKTLFMVQVFSVISTGQEPVSGAFTNVGVVVEEDNYYSLKTQLSAIRQIKNNSSLQLSIFKDVAGKNSGNGGGLSAAIWYGF